MEENILHKVILVTRILERSKGREKEVQALHDLLDTASTSMKSPQEYVWRKARETPGNTVLMSKKIQEQIKQLDDGYVKFVDSVLYRLETMLQYVPTSQQNHQFNSLKKKYERIYTDWTETNRKWSDFRKQIADEHNKTQLMNNVERFLQDFVVSARKNISDLRPIELKVQQLMLRIQAQLIEEIKQTNETQRSSMLQDTNELMKAICKEPYSESETIT